MSKKTQPTAKLQSQVASLKKQLASSQKKKSSAPRGVPASYAQTLAGSRPSFSGGKDFITVSHRELIGVLEPENAEWSIVLSAKLNPGNAELFPWLSKIAYNWESFNFRSLRFHYRTRSSTQKDGVVQLFADYDIADYTEDINPDYLDEGAASSFQGFVETPPFLSCTFTCDKKALQQGKGMKYIVPPGGVPMSADPSNYYVGAFFAATSGNITSLGSVWVEYTVDLYTPSVIPAISALAEPNYVNAGSTQHSCTSPAGVFKDWFCVEATEDKDTLYRSNVVVESSDGTHADTLVLNEPGWYQIDWYGNTNGATVWSSAFDSNGFSVTQEGTNMDITETEDAWWDLMDPGLYSGGYYTMTKSFNFLLETIDELLPATMKMIFGPNTILANTADLPPASTMIMNFLDYTLSYLGPGLLAEKKKRPKNLRTLGRVPQKINKTIRFEKTVGKPGFTPVVEEVKEGKMTKTIPPRSEGPHWRGAKQDAHVILHEAAKAAEGLKEINALRRRLKELEIDPVEKDKVREKEKEEESEDDGFTKVHAGSKRKL